MVCIQYMQVVIVIGQIDREQIRSRMNNNGLQDVLAL